MLKRILFSLLWLCTMPVMAQGQTDDSPQLPPVVCIGYLSYDSALCAMADYALVNARMETLRQAYESELKRVEDEFNRKYEEFLDGRKDFPRTILLKRQTELQQLLESNLAFKQKGLREMEQARQEAMAPLRQKLGEAIAKVAREYGLAVVVNTDSNACPFIEPDMAVDISQRVSEIVSR